MMSQLESVKILLKQSPANASQIIGFNFNVAEGLHPERQKLLFPALPSGLWSNPRFSNRLSKMILSKSSIDQTAYLQIPNALWPIALLPSDRLERLALLVGALILGVRIRTSLSRDHVTSWKKKLGDEAYHFAMNSASLLPTAQIPLPAIASDSALDIGVSAIHSTIAAEPDVLKARVILKLPNNINLIPMEPEKARRVLLLVMQLVEREWHSLHAILKK